MVLKKPVPVLPKHRKQHETTTVTIRVPIWFSTMVEKEAEKLGTTKTIWMRNTLLSKWFPNHYDEWGREKQPITPQDIQNLAWEQQKAKPIRKMAAPKAWR